MYVDELIGADTVNTVPPATMDAYRDHGKPRNSLEEDVGAAEAAMKNLATAGVSIDEITSRLVADGVRLFADAADQLYAAVQKKRRTFVLADRLNSMSVKLPEVLDNEVKARLEDGRRQGKIRRLWAGDASLWTGGDEGKWLGWLGVVAEQIEDAAKLKDFAADVKKAKFSDVLLLGMGGSSLGPEVFAETFGSRAGFPKLHVLDSTDPAQIAAFEKKIDC